MPKTVKRRKNKLAGRYRNRWPDEAEISGRMIPKWVADSCRNRWPDHPEICNTRFCSCQRIEIEAQKLFSTIDYGNTLVELSRDDLVITIAELYADLNVVHPFREGNGRAQRILFEHIIINCGFEIDWSIIEPGEWLEANIKGYYCDYSLMRSIFEKCIGSAF